MVVLPMARQPVVPKRDNLRKAIRWLSDRGEYSLEVIDQPSPQFDLSPQDEQFLIEHFLKSHQQSAEPDRKH